MILPNYEPKGRILFGSVPWDNTYQNVRLYDTLPNQYNDILSMMKRESDNYVYIGRNRRLKVAIEADKLYHMNYCMYQNESLTDGWIYCFITDVEYINDSTSEITLETDIFQTYLYGEDWVIPPCFIERETVASEDSKYLYTKEPDFPLVHKVTAQTDRFFRAQAIAIQSCEKPTTSSGNIFDDILNPSGWYGTPVGMTIHKGLMQGSNIYATANLTSTNMGAALDQAQTILQGLTFAGAIDSVVSVFTIPDLVDPDDGWQGTNTLQDSAASYAASMTLPAKGTTVDGYKPKNKKLFYYPYTYARLTDFNGSHYDYRYELMGTSEVQIKYAINPNCQALAYLPNYNGATNSYESGIVTNAGALGSFSNDTYATWLGQNGGSINLVIAEAAGGAMTGEVSFGEAGKNIHEAHSLADAGYPKMANIAGTDALRKIGKAGAIGAATGAVSGINQIYRQSHQPTVSRGCTTPDMMFQTGAQGIHGQRIQVIASIAQQVDEFFTRYGYNVERVEAVNITSRTYWNFIKTDGAVPKSKNTNSGDTAPFSRGRGTPAAALAVIKDAFDGGVTFWHTTANFGDYSKDNTL